MDRVESGCATISLIYSELDQPSSMDEFVAVGARFRVRSPASVRRPTGRNPLASFFPLPDHACKKFGRLARKAKSMPIQPRPSLPQVAGEANGSVLRQVGLTGPKQNLSLVVLFQKVTLKVYSEKSIVEQIQETLAHLHEIFVRSANAQVLLDGLSFDY